MDMKETPERRREVEAALTCKWWGIRRKAIFVIGKWGGSANRKWLQERACRRFEFVGYSQTRQGERLEFEEAEAARKALWPVLDQKDAGWLLDMWFSSVPMSYLAFTVTDRLPLHSIQARVEHELRSSNYTRQRLALWLIFMRKSYPEREQIFKRYIHGKDPHLSQIVKSWFERERKRSG